MCRPCSYQVDQSASLCRAEVTQPSDAARRARLRPGCTLVCIGTISDCISYNLPNLRGLLNTIFFIQTHVDKRAFPVWKVIVAGALLNLVASLTILLTAELSLIILTEVGHLGLGMPPDVPRWAKIIANGKNHLNNAWWISTLPGLMIAVVVIAIGLMDDWARKRLNRTGWEMI